MSAYVCFLLHSGLLLSQRTMVKTLYSNQQILKLMKDPSLLTAGAIQQYLRHMQLTDLCPPY